MTTLKLRIEKGKLRIMQQSIPKKGEMLPSVYSTIKSQLSIFNFVLIFSVLLSACTDVSDVTDPDSREDIASWYKDDGAESSSSVTTPSSSSVAVSSSSSVVPPSSSSVAALSSSSAETPSSSSAGFCTNTYGTNTVTDCRDNHTYKTVVIGSQTWMAENLAYLPSVNARSDSSSIMAKYYVYDYDGTSMSMAKASSFYTTYGVLYNWAAAGSACPSGWHLPSSAEWRALEGYVGDSAGTKLKAKSSLWSINTGTDAYGFSALPGGSYSGSDFSHVLSNGNWWTATETKTTDAYFRYMDEINFNVYSYEFPKSRGFSVRCMQN